MFLSVCNTFIGLKSNCLKVCCTSIPILLYKLSHFTPMVSFRGVWGSVDKHFLNHLGRLSNIKWSNLLGEMGWNLPSLALGLKQADEKSNMISPSGIHWYSESLSVLLCSLEEREQYTCTCELVLPKKCCTWAWIGATRSDKKD
jgi:hypothetical protein